MSISQTTEMGTVYTIEEIAKLKQYCLYGYKEPIEQNKRRVPWKLHLDGARIANAAVKLGRPLPEIVRGKL
jgi:threonine aldolase